MAAYGVCFVLVLSFILFEVLDVDGSDFPIHAAATLKVADPAQDVRRAPAQPARTEPAIVVALDARTEKLQLSRWIGDARSDTPWHAVFQRGSRHTLARAVLPDASPSA